MNNIYSYALVLNFIPTQEQLTEINLEQFKNMSEKNAEEIINNILNTYYNHKSENEDEYELAPSKDKIKLFINGLLTKNKNPSLFNSENIIQFDPTDKCSSNCRHTKEDIFDTVFNKLKFINDDDLSESVFTENELFSKFELFLEKVFKDLIILIENKLKVNDYEKIEKIISTLVMLNNIIKSDFLIALISSCTSIVEQRARLH